MKAVEPWPTVYLIPGLGADARVFKLLRLAGPAQVLDWLEPQSPLEPLEHYATRMAAVIPVAQCCWLVGVSFGGVLAAAIAELRPLARVVLISSISQPAELPLLARLVRRTGLHWLLPMQALRYFPPITRWLFSIPAGPLYVLLQNIIHDTDPAFAKWAVHQLLNWRGGFFFAVPCRLHGSNDRLLPIKQTTGIQVIPNAGHFMIATHAVAISQWLNELFMP